MERAVIGVVDTPLQANAAVERLRDAGFGSSDISLLYPDRHGTHDFGFEHRSKSPEGAVFGVVAGAIIGGAIGILAGVGLLAVPVLGVLVAAGPVLALLSGAAIGALILGLLGALAGSRMPEIEARLYAGKTKFGSILVSVHTDRARERRVARNILREVAAADITTATESEIPISARLDERTT